MSKPKAPALSRKSRQWFRQVSDEYQITEPHLLKILGCAARTLDEIAQAEMILAKDGLSVKDRFGQVREHPLASAVRSSRMNFSRLCRELCLDTSEPTAGDGFRTPRLKIG